MESNEAELELLRTALIQLHEKISNPEPIYILREKWWSLNDMALYFRRTRADTLSYTAQPNFPTATTPSGVPHQEARSKRRWRAAEVIAWTELYRGRRIRRNEVLSSSELQQIPIPEKYRR